MKLYKLASISFLILCLLFLSSPLQSVFKSEAAGPYYLAISTDKTTYNANSQVLVTPTVTNNSTTPSNIKITGRLLAIGQTAGPEVTIVTGTIGGSTTTLSGARFFTAPPTSTTFYIQIRVYITPDGTQVAQNNTATLTSVVLPNPVVTVTANGVNPLTVNSGTIVRIKWYATNTPTSCKRMDTLAIVPTNGSTGFTETMTATKTFTITCYN